MRDPTQKGCWKQFIRADSFNALRYRHVYNLQLHLIYVTSDG